MKVKYFVSTSFLRTACFLACLSCTSSFAHDLHIAHANPVQIMCNIISGQKRFDGVPAKSAAELSVKGASHWGTKILRGQSPLEKWHSAVLGGAPPDRPKGTFAGCRARNNCTSIISIPCTLSAFTRTSNHAKSVKFAQVSLDESVDARMPCVQIAKKRKQM